MGNHFLHDFGSEFTVDLEWQLMESLTWKTRLYGYSTYKRTELEWENTIVGKEVKMKKLLVILSLFMVFMFGYGNTLDVNVEKGSKVPNFELKDFRAQKVKSRKFFNSSKPTLFVVAAEWCPDCHEELPAVQKFYDEK